VYEINYPEPSYNEYQFGECRRMADDGFEGELVKEIDTDTLLSCKIKCSYDENCVAF
jgi:hypothetical protein